MMRSQDLFSYLPQEIIFNILSILPIETITRCKFVCKSWRDLIESPDFEPAASSHLSKSSFLAVVLDKKPYEICAFEDLAVVLDKNPYEICAFEDQHLVRGRWSKPSSWLLRQNLPTPHENNMRLRYLSSAKGLFLMHETPIIYDDLMSHHNLSICNPTTREYMKLPPPRIPPLLCCSSILGFGVSKTSGKYKVVKIFASDYDYFGHMCEVYTLGTGLWRSHIFNLGSRLKLVSRERNRTGAFVNGNLHWLVSSSEKNSLIIYGFDLETECFTISFAPPLLLRLLRSRYLVLSALEDRLCLCDVSPDSETVIWVMKDYGDEKSRTKQLSVIISRPYYYYSFSGCFFPVKFYEDGDMLFAMGCPASLYRYSNEKETTRRYSPLLELRNNGICGVAIYTPNFVSLKSLLQGNQNV